MVGLDGFDGVDDSFDDEAEELDEGELVFGVVDLAAVEGDPGAMLLGVVQHLEGVEGGAGGAAEDADDEVGVVGDELFEGLRAVVDDLQEAGAAGAGDAGEHADDVVVQEAGEFVGGQAVGQVGVEDFEEVVEALAFGLGAEGVEAFEGDEVEGRVVVEGDGVEAEIGAFGRVPRARSRGGRTGLRRGTWSGGAWRGRAA